MIIDAHAHLAQSPDGSPDVGARIAGLKARGFAASFQGGVGPEDWDLQLAHAARDPDFFKPVLGLHPWWVIEHTREECLEALKRLGALLEAGPRPLALGELGLDFFRGDPQSAALQREVFERQLEMAGAGGFALVLHVVHAHEVALGILRDHAKVRGVGPEGRSLRGIVHAFSGSYEIAQEYLRLGLKLSIGPGLAEPGRFKQLKAALPRLAPTDWVLESDGEGPELMRAAHAAAGLTAREVAEVLETSAKTLQTIFF